MVTRTIGQELMRLDPGNPGYVGKIARWTRGQLDTVEGLYASPLQPDAAAYTTRVITDLARRYPLDGVHLDYTRYPNQQFDYSRFAIAEFRADIRPRISADARHELDVQAEADLFAYPDRFPAQWKAFRRTRLTELVARIREEARAAPPNALPTSARLPHPPEAFD